MYEKGEITLDGNKYTVFVYTGLRHNVILTSERAVVDLFHEARQTRGPALVRQYAQVLDRANLRVLIDALRQA